MWPDSDPLRSDNGNMPSVSPVPNQVCIISRDPLQAFIAALNPTLRAREELTIIVDRRGAGLENVAARPAIERRHHPSVDAKVKTDGFAIVPLSTTEDPRNPPWIERVVDPPVDLPSVNDDSETDELELQRILEFKRRRKARVGPLVRVGAIVGAFSVLVVLFVVFFVQMPTGKALVNRVSERTVEPPSEPHAPAVVEAPVPREPSRLPAERIDTPPEAGRTPTEVVSPPPSPRAGASLQSKRRPATPRPAPPARSPSVSEPADTGPTPRPEVAPPAPPRPLTVASPEPTSPPAPVPEPARPTPSDSPQLRAWPSAQSASVPDSTRSSEGTPTRKAPTASTPGEATTSPSSAPRQPGARGLEAGIQALESHVTRDAMTAGAEAKRQIDELKSKSMKRLDEMRRMWNNATQVFWDKDANQAQGEAAAKPRR
jgi:hypothetical protein